MSSEKDLAISITTFVAGSAVMFIFVLLAGTVALTNNQFVGDSGIRQFVPIGLRWFGSLAVGYSLILGVDSAVRRPIEWPRAMRSFIAGICATAILFSLMMLYGSGMSSIGRLMTAALCGAVGAGQALFVSRNQKSRAILDAA